MGIGTFLFGLFAAGSGIGAGLENHRASQEKYTLPNGMEYWIDRLGCFRLASNGRKISIRDANDPKRLQITDIERCEVIYDAGKALSKSSKEQLIELNEIMLSKAREKGYKYTMQWVPPYSELVMLHLETGKLVEDKWRFIWEVSPSVCGTANHCRANKYDYGTAPCCRYCVAKRPVRATGPGETIIENMTKEQRYELYQAIYKDEEMVALYKKAQELADDLERTK